MSTIDLYHRTSIEAAQAILAAGRLESEVDWVLFPVFYWVTGVTCD